MSSSAVVTTTPARLNLYRVAADAALTGVQVEACFEAWMPDRLLSRVDGAEQYLRDLATSRGSVRADLRGAEIRLAGGRLGDCVSYRVDLAAATGDASGRTLKRHGDDLLLTSGLWLWRPEHLPADADVEIRFALPPGTAVSVPWRPMESADHPHTYRLGRTPFQWSDLMAFGRFEPLSVQVPGGTIRLAVLDAHPAADVAGMTRWIQQASAAVTTLYGRFPLPTSQVLVVPSGAQGEAVPWAQVLRGGAPAAHFFVDQHRPLDEYLEDWTAAHELSHMLLPYVARRDAWLSEGFASYYQNVLRARAGMLSEQAAWKKLFAGFQRGRKDTRTATLAEISRDMHRQGAYMRVYWSGAAIALLADVELRKRSAGRHSLDTAMQAVAECCLPSDRRWRAREVFSLMDEATGDVVFAELYDRYVDSRQFPDVAPIASELGIADRRGRLHFSDDSDAAALRSAIMGHVRNMPAVARTER